MMTKKRKISQTALTEMTLSTKSLNRQLKVESLKRSSTIGRNSPASVMNFTTPTQESVKETPLTQDQLQNVITATNIAMEKMREIYRLMLEIEDKRIFCDIQNQSNNEPINQTDEKGIITSATQNDYVDF